MSRNNKLGKNHENSRQNGTHGAKGAWGKEVSLPEGEVRKCFLQGGGVVNRIWTLWEGQRFEQMTRAKAQPMQGQRGGNLQGVLKKGHVGHKATFRNPLWNQESSCYAQFMTPFEFKFDST